MKDETRCVVSFIQSESLQVVTESVEVRLKTLEEVGWFNCLDGFRMLVVWSANYERNLSNIFPHRLSLLNKVIMRIKGRIALGFSRGNIRVCRKGL